MAKIAAELLAHGDGWQVRNVICNAGPDDRPFEEQHSLVSIAIVTAGTFQYRTGTTPELMAPGAFFLGHPKQSFECAHDHGTGDRCISFQYAPEFFERITGTAPRFRVSRLPPLRASAPLVARACAAMRGAGHTSWEELSVLIATHTALLANDIDIDAQPTSPSAFARVTKAVRTIDRHPDAALSLDRLARSAGLSPFHFLRTFTRITGTTPHQFALRARLRTAALRLTLTRERIIDVALDSGFGDVSNFNRTFRAEFGVSPRAWRGYSAGTLKSYVPTSRGSSPSTPRTRS